MAAKGLLPKGFRIDGKRFFLTYPKCTLDKQAALDALKGLLESKYLGAIVAKELHDDGEPHLHVYLECSSRISVKNARYFDIEGFHGNYQTVRSVDASKQYVTKDGDVLIDNVCMPDDKKVLTYGNVIPLAAERAKRKRSDMSFDEAVADLISDGYMPENSIARLGFDWASRAFKVRVTGRIDVQDVRGLFKN